MDPVPQVVLVYLDEAHDLHPTHTIGREQPPCRLRVDHPDVHGIHATISLRDGRLHLLGDPLEVNGQPTVDLALAPGQRIHLAEDCFVEVAAVHNPAQLWRLHLTGAFPVPLQLPDWSILAHEGQPQPGLRAGAEARLIVADGAWHLLGPRGRERLEADQDYGVGARTLRVELVEARDASAPHTAVRIPALTIRCQLGTSRICAFGRPDFVIEGVLAELFWAVARLQHQDGTPPRLERVGQEVWGRRDEYRTVYNRTVTRLRAKLVEANLPGDLLHRTGHGTIAISLRPIDQLTFEE